MINPYLLAFALLLVALQFLLPRRYAYVPLLIAALHTPIAQAIPNFSAARLVILAGLLRALASGDLSWNRKKA